MAEIDATRACVVCGNAFAINGRQNACSAKCKAERTKQVVHKCKVKCGIAREKEQKTCAGCGKTFATARASQVHCSTACRMAAKALPPERGCVVCGNSFQRYKIKAVCSDACAAIRQRKYQATSDARKVKPTKQCQWCKAEFTPARGVGNKYCCKGHSDLAKKARDNAREHDAEKARERAKRYRETSPERVAANSAKATIRRREERALHGRGDRSKEYEAKRLRKSQPVLAALLWIDAQYHLAHIEALAINAELARAAREQAKAGRMKFESDAEEFRWKYRNDPLFRQAQIQRSKTQKLRRKKQQSHALTRKDALAVYAERSSCLYCGCRLAIGEKVLDHMDPLSKGGSHDASNLVVSCKKCNVRKAAKDFVKWLPLVEEGRRKLVADWYARKHGAQPEQIGLQLMMAA